VDTNDVLKAPNRRLADRNTELAHAKTAADAANAELESFSYEDKK
jgi:hypothetical protein